MRSLSPKARFLIEAGLHRLEKPALSEQWKRWAAEHPFVRTTGFVNQSITDPMPRELAQGILAALDLLARRIRAHIDDPSTSDRDAANCENDLVYIEDIVSEVARELRAYA
jgi:hypothetical protein